MKKNNVLENSLRLYYLLKIFIIIYYVEIYFNGHSDDPAAWLWPVKWLNHFEVPLIPIVTLFVMAFIFSLWSLWKPFEVTIKVSEAILFFLFFAIYYSHSNIDHGVHGIMYASIFISFIGKNSKNQEKLMHLAVAMFAFTYGLTGLWKLRSLFYMNSISEISLILPYQLAIDMIESGKETQMARELLNLSPFISAGLWIGVIILELSGFLILWRVRLFKYWGVLIILFHFSTAIVMDIRFREAQLMCLIFLGASRLWSPKSAG